MKQFNMLKKSSVKVSLIGLILAVILVCGAVWAEKENNKIDVKTDSTAQLAPSDLPPTDDLDPLRDMFRMQREMDRLFWSPFASFRAMPRMTTEWEEQFARPDMDLREQTDAYHVQMDLPGMDKSGISVEVRDNILTVKAESKRETTKKDGEKLLMRERSSGFMSRSVRLSMPVNTDKVTAEYKDGVLKIVLPKMQTDSPSKRIEIK